MPYPKLRQLYKGKRVVVCGASGLTGRNLYNLFQDLSVDVTGTCFHNQHQYVSGMSGITDPVDMFVSVDFTSERETRNFFSTVGADLVFVCCAKTYNALVCQSDPESMLLPNIQMVSNILQSCKRHGVQRVVYVSSATVYQDHEQPMQEADLDWNQDPPPLYMGVGWMKRYAEKICQFYTTQGLDVAVVRPTNIYGKHDKTDLEVCHVVPALIMRALSHQDPFRVHGTGLPVKDFIHAEDLVRDLALVGSWPHGPLPPLNLCSGEHVRICDLVQMVHVASGFIPHDIEYLDTVDAISYRALDNRRFTDYFGQQSYRRLFDGIQEVVKWYSSLRQIPSASTTG